MQRILTGDVIDMLRTLPDASCHCCVTSPPYYALRQYLFDKAVVPRYSLSHEERQKLVEELARRGVKPRI